MTMKVIRPVTVTDSMLISSTASEPGTGEVAWNGATAYTAGQRVIRAATHRVYERIVPGTSATAPESDAVNWLDVAPTNRWAMFDTQISTATEVTSPLTVTLAPGPINAVALLDLVGSEVTVTVTDGAGGPTVYTSTVDLDDSTVLDWYQYVWEPFAQLTEAIFTDIPTYAAARVIVSLTGDTVSCGTMVVGSTYSIGDVYGTPALGIIDYSRKTTDEFGVTTFVQRAFRKKLGVDMTMPMAQFAAAYKILASLRATPCVWQTSQDPALSPLTVYGFFNDFSITVAYRSHVLCALSIEGL